MVLHRSFFNFFKYLFGPLFFVLLVWPIPASSAPIGMEYSLGFNGLFQLDRWTPLNVTLENRGRATNGTLEVVVTSGSEYRRDVHDTTYSMDVELPTNSKKLYSFAVFIDSYTHPVIIRVRQAEKTILSTSVDLRARYTTEGLILVLGTRIAPGFLSGLPKGVQAVSSRAPFLPETWYGYDGVEMLILHASALRHLRERQFIALTEWIRKGGYLITAGSHNTGPFLEERTRRLLPVNILGFKETSELTSLEAFCGQRLTSPDPFLIVNANVEESAALLKEGDTAVLIQKEIGLGRVLFFAVDYMSPPFTDWAGRRAFWSEILALRPPVVHSSTNLEEQGILSSMISEIPLRFPPFVSALLFVAVYLILVQILFKRLEKNRGRRWKNLGYLMAIIFVFSMATYGLFFSRNAQKDLSYNSFLHLKIAGQNRMASSKHIVGVYSLQDGDYRLRLSPAFQPVAPILPDRPEDETRHILALHENTTEQTVLISLDRWSHRFFKISSTIDFPIRGEAFMDEQGLVIAIENRTQHAIMDCQIYFSNRLFSLGDLVPSKKQVQRLARSVIDEREPFQTHGREGMAKGKTPNAPTPFLEKMQKNLMKGLLASIHSQYASRHDALHLFGWIDSDVMPIHLMGSSVTGEGLTLLEWEIPITP